MSSIHLTPYKYVTLWYIVTKELDGHPLLGLKKGIFRQSYFENTLCYNVCCGLTSFQRFTSVYGRHEYHNVRSLLVPPLVVTMCLYEVYRDESLLLFLVWRWCVSSHLLRVFGCVLRHKILRYAHFKSSLVLWLDTVIVQS